MDVSITGFFSHFPNARELWLNANWVYGHFENFDAISSEYLPDLELLEIDYNYFTGSVALSNGHSLSSSLEEFEIDSNRFSGTVQWDIFKGLYNLEEVDMENNFLNGTIDWDIIADLVIDGALTELYLDNNNFTGMFVLI